MSSHDHDFRKLKADIFNYIDDITHKAMLEYDAPRDTVDGIYVAASFNKIKVDIGIVGPKKSAVDSMLDDDDEVSVALKKKLASRTGLTEKMIEKRYAVIMESLKKILTSDGKWVPYLMESSDFADFIDHGSPERAYEKIEKLGMLKSAYLGGHFSFTFELPDPDYDDDEL